MNLVINRVLLILIVSTLFQQTVLARSSEFIDDIPELIHDPDRVGAKIWVKPDFNRADYTKVMVEPITIFISTDSKYKGLNADELKALADEFHKTLITTLEPEVPVVTRAGPGVLYVRAAIVDVKLAKKKRGLLGYTPIGIVATAVADAAGARISLKDAEFEIETLDSISGERLGVLIDKAPVAPGDEKLSWKSIGETFAFYAERFKTRLHESK